MSKRMRVFTILLGILLLGALIGVYKYREKLYQTRELKGIFSVGKRETNVNCIGTGKPTVIFEHGLNEPYTTFGAIQSEIAKITRTFSYDRVMLNDKYTTGSDRSSQQQVENLHLLLKKLKIKGPYIIVAHSMAGFNARLFASTYPGEVVGIVFIDCSHENMPWESTVITDNGELTQKEVIKSATQVRNSVKKEALRNIPITVMTADYKNQDNEFLFNYLYGKHEDIASLSDISKHIIAEDSGHNIQSEHPELVISEIKLLLQQIKK